MDNLMRLARALDRIVSSIGKLSTWLALALITIILFDVVTRRFLVLGSTKLQELEWHIHTVLFMFCVGFTYLADGHVRIDLFRAKMSRRVQEWIELVGCLIFIIPFCGILFYLSIDYAYDSFVDKEVSSAGTGLPHRWIIKSCLSIGFALLLLSGICNALKRVIVLFGPTELVEQIYKTEQLRAAMAIPAALVSGVVDSSTHEGVKREHRDKKTRKGD